MDATASHVPPSGFPPLPKIVDLYILQIARTGFSWEPPSLKFSGILRSQVENAAGVAPIQPRHHLEPWKPLIHPGIRIPEAENSRREVVTLPPDWSSKNDGLPQSIGGKMASKRFTAEQIVVILLKAKKAYKKT